MSSPLASIIIVARDEEDNLDRCLTAVRAQSAPFEYEIVVVDSGSRDRTVEIAKSFGARVIEISRSAFQHGATRQMASEAAAGEYLVYLVADATPADEHWLARLVEAVAADARVAGAYSRQVPRDGAGPIEAYRLRHRLSSGRECEVRELGPGHDFWSLSAEERFCYCEFDDVSCCRRASLLDRYPIPPVDWAEDLVWARQLLLEGHRIVFEPASVVKHSHPDTIMHAFRRGYLDQNVVKRWFGVLYFDTVGALASGYPRLFARQTRTILETVPGWVDKARWTLWNAGRLGSEMAGNYLASRQMRTAHVAVDLARVMGGRLTPSAMRLGQVLRTRFTVSADSRPVLFMNPNASASARVRIPPGARLEFGAAINPAARPFRSDPALFVAAVDGEPVWSRELAPGVGEPRWCEGAVDLSRWAGRRTRIDLITRAKNTDHAWAGWGAPRIVVDQLSIGDQVVNWILEKARWRAMGEPLRHP